MSFGMNESGSRETPPNPHFQIPSQIQTLPLASQATLGTAQILYLSPPKIFYTFCKTLNTQLSVRREAQNTPECGLGSPHFLWAFAHR